MDSSGRLHGLMAEFAGPSELLKAAESARQEGYRRVEAYSPMPVKGLAEALGERRNPLALPGLIGGVVFGAGMYLMQWYSVSVNYPLNIGDRTPAWPALIPPSFDVGVLGAALAIFFGVLFGSALPRLIHPVFHEPSFAGASSDRFFLCVLASDRVFEARRTREMLERMRPLAIREVPA
jgi:hypothetical protein